jgi:hypothetical protein
MRLAASSVARLKARTLPSSERLPPARDGPREEHVGHVDADDQEQEIHHDHQERAGLHRAGLEAQGAHHGRERDPEPLVVGRILLCQTRGDSPHLGRRGGDPNSLPDAADDAQRLGPAVVEQLRQGEDDREHGERDPQLCGAEAGHPLEVAARHADDGERLPVQKDFPAEDARIGAEAALPEAVADHDFGTRAGSVRGACRKTPAKSRPGVEDLEEVAGDDLSRDLLGLTRAGRETHPDRLIGGEIGEDVIALP